MRRIRALGRPGLVLATVALALACGGGGGGGSNDGPPYQLKGRMPAAGGTAVDSDTNDPSASLQANDSLAQAQEIPNPVTLGGHVNVAGAKPAGAPDGATTVAGDPEDWFRVALAADQRLLLQIAEDGATNDLDLELYEDDGTFVAASSTTARSEEIVVPAADDYHVRVVAQSGFSNYTLTVGQAPMHATRAPVGADFVPGEIIVRYHEPPPGAALPLRASSRAAALGMRHLAGREDGPMLFSCREPEQRAAAFRALGLEEAPAERRVASDLGPSADEALREDTRRLVEALRREPDVASADLNYLRRSSAVPIDEHYPLQWHYEQIDLPQAWDLVAADSGVVVAVVDTGVVLDHPDLAGQLVSGYDFISSASRANDGDGCDADPDDPGDEAPGGSSYHGTHVAGTVSAATSFLILDGDEGGAGVAWNARVMPLRVLGVGGGSDFDILAALNYAAGLDNSCMATAAQSADIVNMSFGAPGFSQTFQDRITELRDDHGLIFVAAAGNDGSSSPIYPAAFAGVISVSAVGPTKTLAPYSNFGSSVDVAAPGGDFERDVDGNGFPDGVLSTLYDESADEHVYAFYQGTSMAAPHVAGVLALMLGVNPAITPFDIDNWLNLGDLTEDIGSSNFFGNGLIDAFQAVNKADTEAGGGGAVLPLLRVDPDALNYGLIAEEFVLSASNGGNPDADLTVSGVVFTSDDGDDWLTLVDEADATTGLGDYRAQVDRTGLDDGLYTGTIRFSSDRNDVDVSVIMQVGDAENAESNAGHHYVLLVEPGTFTTVDFLEEDASEGTYRFRFGGVAPGEYLVVAGTDSDNDFQICDPGEACGAYPTTETVVPVEVEDDESIRFVTGFGSSVGAAAASVAPPGGFSRRIGEGPPD